MEAVKLLIGFAPWIAFWIISAGHSLFWLKTGVVVAALLVAVMGVSGLHRGGILWAGVVFFSLNLVAVVWLENMWVVRHMGVMASGFLLAMTLVTMALGRPFTGDYAKQHVAPRFWDTPEFRHSCQVTTGVWAVVFGANTTLNVLKLVLPHVSGGVFELLEVCCLVAGVFYTTRYAAKARSLREAMAREQDLS
ncbi:hypothetical protein JCM15519_00680 [Fundidesulfovibrio butyratiphilus]